MTPGPIRPRPVRGFTLVELMVALFALAVLALLSYRGVDGMVRTREITQAHTDETLALRVGLAQWNADLDAMIALDRLKSIDWNGRVLRVTRRSADPGTTGVVVAAWTRRLVEGRSLWLRWQSPPVGTRGELEQAWTRADQWAQNPGSEDRAREVTVLPVEDWQIVYYRQNAWTNPLSSGITSGSVVAAAPATVASGAAPAAAASPPATQAPPDGVRLILVLPPGGPVSGTLVRDWVRPDLT